jgi:hypothetical protein
MGYDIIGDIHGQADKLEALLRTLGYRESAGAWRHSHRQAIFVGDFVDRGPAQVRSIQIVRRMADAGAALAVMGNHELNAIAWHTPDPRRPGQYLRSHDSAKWGAKNRKQHGAFLAEVEDAPALHTEIIDWFLTLPLWLNLPALQVVHACRHSRFIAWLAPRLHRNSYLTRDLMVLATDEPENETEKGEALPSVFKAVECLTKGVEVSLPAGHDFRDKDGIVRNRVRVRWWDENATTFRTAAMLAQEERQALPDSALPAQARVARTNKPVFFGHYWLTGTPSLQSSRAVCVDYSAGNDGPLVAYRFDAEPELSPERLVWVA